MDISICLPSIRVDNLEKLYASLLDACGDLKFELIVIGPYEPKSILNVVQYIEDFGCPTRCIQRAILECRGRLYTSASDDGVFVKDSISEAVKLYDEKCSKKDGVIMRYTEGEGMPTTTKSHSNSAYWTANYHPPLRLKGINPNFMWGVPLLDVGFLRDIGGLDCRFEHYNYCTHDLCYRIQNYGGKFHLSPTFVMNCDWNPHAEDYKPVLAVAKKDYRLFRKIYKRPTDRLKIDINNWKDAPDKWLRFQ